jgi:hypothetical protein
MAVLTAIKKLYVVPTLHLCVFRRFQVQAAAFALLTLTDWFCITVMERVYCMVRVQYGTHFVFKG